MQKDTQARLLISGHWMLGEEAPFETQNPATGQSNGWVASASARQVDQAVCAAWEAVNEPGWREMLPHVRAGLLRKIADGVDAEAEPLAELQMRENGKIARECKAQVASASATFRYYASVCETLCAEVTPPRGNYLSLTNYQPYGVVAAITPWNSPLTMVAQKLAPALAAGNAVVVKPSEVTPLCALALARIASEAGLPPALVNVLTGGPNIGRQLVEHRGVRMVTFTGGTQSGRAIAQAAGARLLPVSLELGGKSPHIIWDDARQDAAIEGIVDGIFESSGQSCVAGSRIFVHKAIASTFVPKLVERARTLKVGMPQESGVEMGSIASFLHRDRIEAMVVTAKNDGGTILAGGARPDSPDLAHGAFYLPTLITGLDATSKVVREEIFGPVACILEFEDEDDLVKQANDTVFGLAAGIWTEDMRRAWRVATRLEAGSVWINTYKQVAISTPFGGFKDSGIGREKGLAGMRIYQQAQGIYFGM
ncbi:aldehyde dehydrogenase [Alcaligenaceae bacterium]|nr:aldehyde dehydrogenase [Alcaligenaceae bacterium]